MTLYEMQIYYRIMERSLQKEQAYITQKELCDELDAPKTSINSIIKRQLKTGYIEMEVNPANRREKIISLTETKTVCERTDSSAVSVRGGSCGAVYGAGDDRSNPDAGKICRRTGKEYGGKGIHSSQSVRFVI